jgi:hypothetical protein
MKDGKKVEDTDCNEILELTSAGFPHVHETFENALFSDLPPEKEEKAQEQYSNIMNMEENRTEFKCELSKVIPTSYKKIKKMSQVSKEFLQISYDKGYLTKNKNQCQENKQEKQEHIEEPIRRPDILGISPGKLMLYRDLYRKDGSIKAPASIMNRIQESEIDRDEYLCFLQSE